MHSKIKRIGCAFLFLLFLSLLLSSYALCQQLAVKRQTDGTIKIQSIPSRMKVLISNMVYCRTIDELIKEEKDSLNRLISDNRYDEVKDSIDIIEGLRQLKVQRCN
jgi:hypothetical protein